MGLNIAALTCISILFAIFVFGHAALPILGNPIQSERFQNICLKGKYDHCKVSNDINEIQGFEGCNITCYNEIEKLFYCCHLDVNTQHASYRNNQALLVVIIIGCVLGLIVFIFNVRIVCKFIMQEKHEIASRNSPLTLNGDYVRFDVGGDIAESIN